MMMLVHVYVVCWHVHMCAVRIEVPTHPYSHTRCLHEREYVRGTCTTTTVDGDPRRRSLVCSLLVSHSAVLWLAGSFGRCATNNHPTQPNAKRNIAGYPLTCERVTLAAHSIPVFVSAVSSRSSVCVCVSVSVFVFLLCSTTLRRVPRVSAPLLSRRPKHITSHRRLRLCTTIVCMCLLE